MGTVVLSGNLPHMIFAITFCLITTKVVADKPNMYASPPPVHRQFDDYPPSLIPPPTPDSQDHPPSYHKSPPSSFNEQEVLNFLNALPPLYLNRPPHGLYLPKLAPPPHI